ncbi:MAG: peptidoglycan DD-metalloendopeptidase family protein [Acidimicrobiia bacterium]|nr:peptidoglycan DD-metalloendopeptidase family protein [Acidimicrobiia bacterium]
MRERGSATVLTALLTLVALIVIVAMVALAAVASARWSAQTAADAAALAAALDLHDPEGAARRLANEHESRVVECDCGDGRTPEPRGRRTVVVEVAAPINLPALGTVDVMATAAAEFVPTGGGCPLDPRLATFVDSWGAPRSGGRKHLGTDVMAPHGVPVFAVADGLVRTGSNTLGGKTIWLHSDAGPDYYYAHLADWAVESGARVQLGDVIASNGNTGNARYTPPHVHFQNHPDGRGSPPVNPYPILVEACHNPGSATASQSFPRLSEAISP